MTNIEINTITTSSAVDGDAVDVDLTIGGRSHTATLVRDHGGRYTTTWAASVDMWLSDGHHVGDEDVEAVIDAVQSAAN